MRAHTPQQVDVARRRSSIAGAHRTSIGSSIPRPPSRGSQIPQSRIAMARTSATQPTYDFLTGAETTSRPPSRDRFRQSSRMSSSELLREKPAAEPNPDIEKHRREADDLKAEVKSLKYVIDNHKQEEELTKLRHESELRDARRKAEEDFKKMQMAEAEKSKAMRQFEGLLKEMTEVRDAASNDKAAFDKRLRDVEEGKRLLEEELDDIKSGSQECVRNVERKASDLESRNRSLQQTVEELQQDSDGREIMLKDTQRQLAERDATCGTLEAEVLRLRAQNGDADTLGVIKRELSEQVSHIRTLEASNREQAAELKHYKKLHKSIEVVQEEKRSLQRKVDSMEALENELGEAKLQRQRLEDERLAWTAYLESQAGPEGQIEFDSPEALARALVGERLQTASLVERLGSLEPEVSEKDSQIQSLEAEKANLLEQLEKLKLSGTAGSESKSRLRLERQRALAVKEVEYLRAQLKTFDSEDTTFQPENVDEAKIKRIDELEKMVDEYRREVQTLHGELALKESPAQELIGAKRPRDESEDNERFGQLSRKNRKLQDELSTLQASTKLLGKELAVARERLTAATERSNTRILSLRSNPTSDYEAIKQATLDTLRKENTDLLAQLQHDTRSSSAKSVPASTLEAAQRDVQEAQEALASTRKSNDRLKKVWLAKSQEFRELVVSLLGWDVMFMPNEKMRVSSFFYPSKGDNENSIDFDGERGTMKISGGPQSAFAMKISDQVNFWVKERSSIPCLLAALTLEFYEEKNGSTREDTTTRVDV